MRTSLNKFYGYIRVSTKKQGKFSASPSEQKASIESYARRQGFQIVEWVEEWVTAAKPGRPLFRAMLRSLRRGEADGIIIHKVDRSARNMSDWGDICVFLDAGVPVFTSCDGLDLSTRSGRLTADMQAVIATDYIRNLREEIRKGINGRLKAGLFPFCAPLGYINTGKGNVKTIDPFTGPLVRQAFQLYATGRYTLKTLHAELHRKGLRNRRRRALVINDLSVMLNNPFYTGLIRIKRTGETYRGVHAPLIDMALFKQVQARLARRLWTKGWIHELTFRGLFQCSLCNRSLIGEIQKGHVYYRCHTVGCPTRGLREEALEVAMFNAWSPVALDDEERQKLLSAIDHVRALDGDHEVERKTQVQTQIGAIKARLSRLIDALLDGAIDKDSFEERKRTLLEEQQSLEDTLKQEAPDPERTAALIAELLELASSPEQSYRLGTTASRRELAIRLCSNRSVAGKDVSVEPAMPFLTLAKRSHVLDCADLQDRARTLEEVAHKLWKWAKEEARKQFGVSEGEHLHNIPPAPGSYNQGAAGDITLTITP
jgi:site-specific DNA recombinase